MKHALLILSTAVALGSFASQSAKAATQLTWTGGTSNVWTLSGNWNNGSGPAPTSNTTANTVLFNSSTYSNQPSAGTTSIGGIEDSGSGNVTITTTALTLGNQLASNTGILMDNGAGTLSIGAVVVGASQNWSNNSSSLLTLSSTVKGTASSPFTLTLNGSGVGGTTITGVISDGATAGTLSLVINTTGGATTLSGANTFTGGVTLSTGTLILNNAKALGTAGTAGAFIINGGTIDQTITATTLTGNAPITIGGNFTYGGTSNLNLGSGAITNAGDRTITLNGTSSLLTMSGVMTNSEGSLQTTTVNGVGNTFSFGGYTLTNSGTSFTDVINGTGNVTITGAISNGSSTASGLTYSGSGAFTASGGFNTNGGTETLTLNSSTNAVSLSGAIAGSGTVVLAGSGTNVTIGVLSGTGAALQINSTTGGAYISSADSTFTGGVTLTAGTLDINFNGISTAGPLGANTGTFSLNGGTIDNTSGSAKIVSAANPIAIGGSFAFSNSAGTSANNLTLGGAVTMAANQSITLNGAGVLTLSGGLTNSADSARTLTVSNGSSGSTFGSLSLSTYALTGAGSSAARNDIINGTGNVAITGIVSDGVSAGSGLTYGGSGTLTLGGANTFTGGFTLNSGTVDINNAGVVSVSGALGNGGAFVINGGTVDTSNAVGTLANNNPITLGGSFAYGGTSNLNLGAGAITNPGDRTISLNGTGKTLTMGGVMTNSEGALQTTTVNGAGNTWSIGGYALSNSNTIAYDDVINGTGNVTITGAVSDSSGSATGSALTYGGSGTLLLSGVNTFTGGINLNSGTLGIGNNAALGTGNLTVAAGATLAVASATRTTTNNNTETWNGNFNIITQGFTLDLGTGTDSLGADVDITQTGDHALSFGGTVTGNHNFIITNNDTLAAGTGGISFNGTVNNSGTFTSNGTGVSAVTTTNGIGSSVFDVVQNDANDRLRLKSGTYAYTGNLVIKAGIVEGDTVGSFGTHTVFIGDSSGSANATLQTGVSGNYTNTAISIASGNTGTATIASIAGSADTITSAITLNSHDLVIAGGGLSSSNTNTAGNIVVTGGITSTGSGGNLTLQSAVGTSAVTLSGANLINNAGTITNIGVGTGTTTISAALGANVGLVTENSTTSVLVLSGNNSAWTNNLLVTAGTVQLGSSATSAVSAANTVTVNSGGTFDVNTATDHIAGLNDVSGSGGTVTNSGAALSELFLDGAGTYSYAGAITSATAADMFVVKNGTGTQTLGGVNTYTNQTQVNAGKLFVNGSLASGTVTVGNNTAVATLGGNGTISGLLVTATTGSNVAHIAPGATTGAVGVLQVGNLGFTVGNGTNFDFDINTATTPGTSDDEITMTGGTLSLGSGIVFNFNQLSALSTSGTYTLISDTAGTISGFSSGNFSATGIGSDTASFNVVGGALVVSFTAGGSESTNYYYTGATSNDFTLAGNYKDALSSGTTHSTALSSTSDVFLTATGATNLPATVGTNTVTIDSLTFNTNTSLNGTGTVTLASSGTALADTATGGTTETVNANLGVGANQTWSVGNSSNTLAVTGAISGSHSLILGGPGAFNFSNGSNSYSGGTTVNSNAKLFITNSTGTTVLGTGSLTVQKGAIFGGSGNASNLAAFNIGSGGTGTTTMMVGSGGIDTSSSLTLKASGASNISSTNLEFNINTAGGGNQLNVGNTLLTFGSGDTLTLNLVGTNIISANTPYILVAGIGGNGDGTLAGSQYAGGALSTGGTSANGNLILNGLTLTFTGSEPPAWYANSYVFLVNSGGVDDIEVEVVPEPSTWALIIGGLGMLVFWQRRKNKIG